MLHRPDALRLLLSLLATDIASAEVRAAFGVLAPFLLTGFDITTGQVGMLVSATFAGMMLAWLPAGLLVDALSLRSLLLGALVSLVLWMGVLSVADSWTLAVVAAFLIGISVAFISPATSKAVLVSFTSENRGRAMGLKFAGNPLGVTLAALLLPTIALQMGWRTALGANTAIAAAMAVFALWNFRIPAGRATGRRPGISHARLMNQLRPLSVLLRDPYYYQLGLIMGALILTQWCVNAYLVIYLHDGLGLPIVWASTFFILAQLVGAAGRLAWTTISDLYFQCRRKPVLRLVAVVGIVSSLLAAQLEGLGTATANQGVVVILFTLVTSILLGLSVLGWPSLIGLVSVEKAGFERAGASSSVVLFLGAWGGVVGPPIFGYLVDTTATYRAAWLGVAVVFLTVIVISRFLPEV